MVSLALLSKFQNGSVSELQRYLSEASGVGMWVEGWGMMVYGVNCVGCGRGEV